MEAAYKQVFGTLLYCDVNFLRTTKLYSASNTAGTGLFDGYSGMAVALFLASKEAEERADC